MDGGGGGIIGRSGGLPSDGLIAIPAQLTGRTAEKEEETKLIETIRTFFPETWLWSVEVLK
jgi:hypothetical protein